MSDEDDVEDQVGKLHTILKINFLTFVFAELRV